MFGQSNSDSLPAYIKPNNQDITVTPTVTQQVFTADQDHTGLGTVTVNAVTSSIDNNITSGNIINGVTILGVTGNATVLNGDTLSVTPSTSAQILTPTSPKNGFTQVSVNAVTSTIDQNITTENIKKDITILGVTGSYEGSGGGDIIVAKNATDSTVIEGNKVWLEKKAGGGTRNFITSGTYTLNDDTGIVTFSNSNGSISKTYAIVFPTPSEYIEVQAKVQGSSNSSGSPYYGLTDFFSGKGNYPLRISASAYSGLQYLRTNITSGTLIDSAAFKANSWYWVKIRITNTTLTPYWSEDGQTWNQGTVYSSSNLLSIFANGSNYFGIRSQSTSSGQYMGGVVDLTETYVKADDTYWWKPYLDTQVGWNIIPYSFSSASSFTGTAAETITNGSTGDVKFILPDIIDIDLYSNIQNAEISVV